MRLLVIIALAVVHPGCVLDDCYELHRRTYNIAIPASPQTQFQIDRCVLDPSMCELVCAQAMQDDGEYGDIRRCRASFGQTHVHLEVIYTDGSGCSSGDDVLNAPDPENPTADI